MIFDVKIFQNTNLKKLRVQFAEKILQYKFVKFMRTKGKTLKKSQKTDCVQTCDP